jgi:hypothetical protein
MKQIPLTQGKFALVDDEDYERLSQFKWFPIKIRNNYYAYRNKLKHDDFEEISMHRMIMHPKKGLVVDHINHDSLDNRKCNLRNCTVAENNRNTTPRKHTSSTYLGVCFDVKRKLWLTQLTVEGCSINIGRFESEIEAAEAYDIAVLEYSKGFGYLNFKEKSYTKTLAEIRSENKRPYVMQDSHKLKMIESRKHIDFTTLHRAKRGKKVIDRATGEIFNSLSELCEKIGMPKGKLSKYLLGTRTNKTTYSYL